MNGQCVAVVSGKGGVGKSMLVAALGAHFAYHRKRTLLVDLNTGMRGLDMLLGLESRIVFDLGDVQDGLCGIEQALIEDRQTGVFLLAARQITDTDALDAEALGRLMREMTKRFDRVLLDVPGGIGAHLQMAAGAAGEALVVTTPDDAAMRGAERVAGALRDIPSPGLVINRIREDFVEAGLQYPPEVCGQVLDMRVTGVVPEDGEVWRRVLSRQAINGDFPAAWAIRNLMERMDDESTPLRPWRKDAAGKQKRGFFGSPR
ncbi:MAG: AAA family ATPase [Firmicutes bacterium]|nr:AAA family ATPase [Bacillota bacterium]